MNFRRVRGKVGWQIYPLLHWLTALASVAFENRIHEGHDLNVIFSTEVAGGKGWPVGC